MMLPDWPHHVVLPDTCSILFSLTEKVADGPGRESMMYLFSREGRQALEGVALHPILYAFDFDGTLVPITSDRASVHMAACVQRLLQELAVRAPCAIVSGRSLDDLTARAKGAVPHLIGNHGLESPFTPERTFLQARDICQTWMETVSSHSRALVAAGLEIEDKQYSLTFHYRNARDVEGMRSAVVNLMSRLTPAPNLLFGKLSVNVLPPGQSGKGPAVMSLMKSLGLDGVLYIGDEDTDESVFELKDTRLMGVRVGRHRKSLAKFYLNHQREVEDVLRVLIHQLDKRRDW